MNSTTFLRSLSKISVDGRWPPFGKAPLVKAPTPTASGLKAVSGLFGTTQDELESMDRNRKTKRYGFIPTEYQLDSFQRSNQDTCITHKPAVFEGDWVQAGDVLTDCASSVGGELSLGQNLLIAYLPWEGYNFEDAILISERLVIDDLYTSVHIERYEMEVHETNLGPEEITRDIPDVSDSEVEKLDSFGIVKIGSWVEEGDILVGKITPIPKNTISPYQKLLYTILEKKVRPFRDTSLRAPKGVKAKVIDIKFFNKANGTAPLVNAPTAILPTGELMLGKSAGGDFTGLAESPPLDSNPNKKRKSKKTATSSLSKTQISKVSAAKRNNLQGSKTSLKYGNTELDLYTTWLGQQPSLYTRLAPSRLKPHHRLGGGGLETGSQYSKQPLLNGLNNYFSALKKIKLSLSPQAPLGASGEASIAQAPLGLWPSKPTSSILPTAKAVGVKRTLGKTRKTKQIKNVFSLSPLNSRGFVVQNVSAADGRRPKGAYKSGEENYSKGKGHGLLATPLPLVGDVFKRPKPKLTKTLPFLPLVQSPTPTASDLKALNSKNIETIHIYLAETRKIQVGDKMSGRHGNKGIVSNILPIQDMPYLPDGTPIDMVLNPLGVPSRMNVGQIYECLLGLAGRYLGENYKVSCFDEIYGPDASRSFVFNKLYEASKTTGLNWLFDPNTPGKVRIYDGRTGDSFDQAVTAGHAYILRLVHMVDDKIHMRSTGPYSLVTQQPLRGRSKEGGQRLGEMEVWALEGYGAAFTLLEMLTIKSDDMTGRMTLWSNLILNKDISIGTPESFKVLICELQALCLDIGLFRYGTNGETRNESSNRQLTEIDSLINLP